MGKYIDDLPGFGEFNREINDPVKVILYAPTLISCSRSHVTLIVTCLWHNGTPTDTGKK